MSNDNGHTLRELRRAKAELSQDVFRLINRFEEEYGVHVNDMVQLTTTAHGISKRTADINICVTL